MTPGMHITNGWADAGMVGKSHNELDGPVHTQTDFKHDCLCHEIIIDGETFIAYSPACEIPGHGLHYRYVSELATPSADPVRKNGKTHSGKEHA